MSSLPLTPRPHARVLVAEDDAEMRALAVNALRADGHDVVELTDGGRLLVEIARSCRGENDLPDLIVSDVRMPVMTGLAMLRGIRDAHLQIPVVLMTAFPDVDMRLRAETLDAAVLAKPFRMEELCAVVRERLARAPRVWKRTA